MTSYKNFSFFFFILYVEDTVTVTPKRELSFVLSCYSFNILTRIFRCFHVMANLLFENAYFEIYFYCCLELPLVLFSLKGKKN